MTSLPTVQELAFVVVAKNHSPNLLNLPFLQCSDIVPEDWETARQPVVNNQVAQVVFKNGINLTAQANRITLAESITDKAPEEVKIPQIAQRYTQALPKMEYEAVNINMRQVVPTTVVGGGNYVINQLVAPGPWTQIGNAPAQASVQFSYTLEGRKLGLSVNQGLAQVPEQKSIPVILFAGSFNYIVNDNDPQGRLASVSQIIKAWQQDLAYFREILDTRFLPSGIPLGVPQQLVT